ncbi:hypothetical protein ACE01N_14960 [Saccharicrinis sp. FJH2]|uniref:hypothetical protein n=1 Tax=Saccharicrinis sp. FJH65 TaxID=3344659 RepID=UPI0035F42F8D
MENIEETIADIKEHIKSKGHKWVKSESIDLYFRFLFENKFSNSKLLVEVFQRDFFEINIEILDEENLKIKWLDVDDTITEKNDTLIILLLSHDEEDIRRGNHMPEKLALYDGLVYYAEKTITNFSRIFDLIIQHKK